MMSFSLQLQIRLLRSLWNVTTGVPSLANANESEWIRAFETETLGNSFLYIVKREE